MSLEPSVPCFLRALAAVAMVVCFAPAGRAETRPDAGDLYLAHANLVDPDARQVREGNLLIRDGVIVGTKKARKKVAKKRRRRVALKRSRAAGGRYARGRGGN